MTAQSLAAIVDVEALAEVALAALVFGVGGTLAFSLTIAAAARFDERRREGRAHAAAAYGVAAALALAVSLAVVALGIIVMVAK